MPEPSARAGNYLADALHGDALAAGHAERLSLSIWLYPLCLRPGRDRGRDAALLGPRPGVYFPLSSPCAAESMRAASSCSALAARAICCVSLFPLLLLDGFTDARNGFDAVSGVGAGSVNQVLEPGTARQSFRRGELALALHQLLVEGLQFSRTHSGVRRCC